MLRVDIDDMGCQAAQERQLHGSVVGEGAALGSGQDLAPQDEGVVVVHIGLVEERLQVEPRNIEACLDDTFALLVRQHGGIGALPKEQSQCPKEYGLAGTRLAGDGDKALRKAYVALANEGIVFDM